MHFRPYAPSDAADVATWFDDPDVARWWVDHDPADLERSLRDEMSLRIFIVVLDGTPIGLVQTYLIEDYPHYADAIRAEPHWAGLDYLIGVASARGRGIGSRMLREVVDEIVFDDPTIAAVVSSPHPDNARSLRALETAGFVTHLPLARTADGPERVMIRRSVTRRDEPTE